MRSLVRWLAAGAGFAAGAYGTYVAVTWTRYGRVRPGAPDETDGLLDLFMPAYEVAERHHIQLAAPAAVTLAAAREMDLFHLPVVRQILRGRELMLGAAPGNRASLSAGLLADARSLGWAVLAEMPDREIVVGAVTRPWEANVVFRPVPPDAFAAFDEPDYAKIVWTLRADPIDASTSVFRTETRVATTDAGARGKFRRYWAWLSPGIVAIRQVVLQAVKIEAERRVAGSRT